jgi:hypothetical protein
MERIEDLRLRFLGVLLADCDDSTFSVTVVSNGSERMGISSVGAER